VQAGYEILFLDEATFKLEPLIIRGWFSRGSKPTTKYVLNKSQKIHTFGALSFGKIVTKLSPKINRKKYFAFLKRLHKHNKKLCIIVDNARWHLTKEVQQFIKKNRIQMIRLPPYSPELNPIEQYWKNIKQWLATRIFYNKQQLINELKKALRKHIFIPNISDY
jgi:putative transposase